MYLNSCFIRRPQKSPKSPSFLLVSKFIYLFWEDHFYLTLLSKFKIVGKVFHISVAFSDYMNFTVLSKETGKFRQISVALLENQNFKRSKNFYILRIPNYVFFTFDIPFFKTFSDLLTYSKIGRHLSAFPFNSIILESCDQKTCSSCENWSLKMAHSIVQL